MDDVTVASSAGAQQCSCSKSAGNNKALVKWTAAGGVLASLGVCAACCLLPFALLSLGVAGALVSALDALAPYKWIFIALTAAFLGYGFYAAYWRPKRRGATGTACEVSVSGTDRSVRIGLWIATVLTICGLVFEHFESMLVSAH